MQQEDNNIVFLQTGRIWENEIEIDFGNEAYTNIELSFRPDTPDNFSESEEESEQLTNN
jgi:hypothetical protein